jgi:Protein of unknown function (DUF2970)
MNNKTVNEEGMKPANEEKKFPSWVGVVLSALAAFIGVQSDKNRERDFQQKSILPFMLVGVVLAAGFIITLIVVAKQLVR